MKICDFTKPELDRFRKECNFTETERRCFDLKAKGMTNYQLAMELNILRQHGLIYYEEHPGKDNRSFGS